MATPTDALLATLADLRVMLPGSPALDANLIRLLGAVSTWFINQVGHPILAQDIDEVMIAGWRNPLFIPKQSPVLSVTSVSVEGTAIPQCVLATDDGWRLIDGVIYLRNVPVIPYGLVEIHYRAGYEAIPADIQQAVLEMTALKFRDTPHLGMQSESMSGQSVSFLPSIIPQSVKNVIDSYKE